MMRSFELMRSSFEKKNRFYSSKLSKPSENHSVMVLPLALNFIVKNFFVQN